MKYEIRILSEEDTVKSKVYDDLDKAIEIADKIYNDFLDLDFGDEIVVCEENKKDKKYWSNGKQIIEEIKIGDIVEIIDEGATYSTYYDFMMEYGTKKNCLGWTYNNSPSVEKNYRVVNIANHLSRDIKLVIIEEIDTYLPKAFIIGIEGVKKI